MDEKTDEILIVEYVGGNEAAFATLVERHLQTVYSFVLRFVGNKEEAEDISQETFLKAWKSIAKYDAASSKFKTWVLRIARNTAIDHLRKKKHIPFSAFSDKASDSGDGSDLFAETIPDTTPLADDIFAAAENREILDRALLGLPPEATRGSGLALPKRAHLF